jgi:hypothetical protein
MTADPWLDALRKKPAFTELMRQAESRHQDAVAAFDRLGGRKAFGAPMPA